MDILKKNQIMRDADSLWKLLCEHRTNKASQLQERSGLSDCQFGMALGWLAREDKIYFPESANGDVRVEMTANLYL